MAVFGGRELKHKGHSHRESSGVRLTGVFHVNILLNRCPKSNTGPNWSVLRMKCGNGEKGWEKV